MNRRDFIRTGSAAALAPSLFLHSCSTRSDFPIIDTHVHLWDYDVLKLTRISPPMDTDFLIPDYMDAVRGLNVVRGIYMEVGVPPEKRDIEAKWALGLSEDPGNLIAGAVIAKDPGEGDFEEYMGKYSENPFLKGIRHFFSTGEEPLNKQVIQNIRLLGSMGLSFDLAIPPLWLPNVIRLVDLCPETEFVLNHCGMADPVAFFPEGKERPRKIEHHPESWIRHMTMIADRPNVICKISGVVSRVRDYRLSAEDVAPVINFCLNKFGPDKVVFGGDWPVVLRSMTLSRWIKTLKEVVSDRSEEVRRKLFHDNAERIYGLSTSL